MRAMNDYLWARDKVEELRPRTREHREKQACERRLAQMAKKRARRQEAEQCGND